MVELIVGKKGKGKTKVLLDKVNGAVKEANGSIVYLDKSTKHMYELNNKVRLIDVSRISVNFERSQKGQRTSSLRILTGFVRPSAMLNRSGLFIMCLLPYKKIYTLNHTIISPFVHEIMV